MDTCPTSFYESTVALASVFASGESIPIPDSPMMADDGANVKDVISCFLCYPKLKVYSTFPLSTVFWGHHYWNKIFPEVFKINPRHPKIPPLLCQDTDGAKPIDVEMSSGAGKEMAHSKKATNSEATKKMKVTNGIEAGPAKEQPAASGLNPDVALLMVEEPGVILRREQLKSNFRGEVGDEGEDEEEGDEEKEGQSSKPAAKGKAKAKAKASNGGEPEMVAEKAEKEKESKAIKIKTFARRYCPEDPINAVRHKAIQAVYEEEIAPKLAKQSSFQVEWGSNHIPTEIWFCHDLISQVLVLG